MTHPKKLPLWLWVGADDKRVEVRGLHYCEDKTRLALYLAGRGVELVRARRLWVWQQRWPKKIAHKHLHHLLGQWAHLLNAGLPILACIELAQAHAGPLRLQLELVKMQRSLLAGERFSQALKGSGLFDDSTVALVVAGESSGKLAQLLATTYDQGTKASELKQRFKRSLFMPFMTLCSGLLVSALIIYWVVPQMAGLYTQGNHSLPLITQWMMDLSASLNRSGIWLVLVPIVAGLMMKILWRNPAMRPMLENLLWKIPGLGRLMYLQAHNELFLVLALTFNAGVPLLESLSLSAKANTWLRIRRQLHHTIDELQRGKKMSSVLTSIDWPDYTVQIIRMGEVSGDLGLSFSQLQGYFEAQTMSQSKWLEQLIESVLLLLVTGFVGCILVALYLPLFQMGQMM